MTVNLIFGALADPTRQQILEWLTKEGSGTATGFARRLPITRQAVARHLSELESSGLVTSARVGRETRFTPDISKLNEASSWLEERAAAWEGALDRLKSYIEASQA